MQGVGGLEHGVLGLGGVAALNQHVARQPVNLPEERNPAQAFLSDVDGAGWHHTAQHEQVVIGLVVGDDNAGRLLVAQGLVLKPDIHAQDAQGGYRINPAADGAVAPVKWAGQHDQEVDEARNDEMDA